MSNSVVVVVGFCGLLDVRVVDVRGIPVLAVSAALLVPVVYPFVVL